MTLGGGRRDVTNVTFFVFLLKASLINKIYISDTFDVQIAK